MAYYRLYFLDGASGRIREFREFEAAGDFAALARAQSWRGPAPMELWCLGRMVRRWQPVLAPPPRRASSASWRS